MARKKKPENETEEQRKQRLAFEAVANHANRSEKTSWNRKMDNMVKLIAKLRPVEQKILKIIQEEKTPIMDEIDEVRKMMIKECVHPFEYLVQDTDEKGREVIRCKFCEKRIGLVNGDKA